MSCDKWSIQARHKYHGYCLWWVLELYPPTTYCTFVLYCTHYKWILIHHFQLSISQSSHVCFWLSYFPVCLFPDQPFIRLKHRNSPVVQAFAGQKSFRLTPKLRAFPAPEVIWYNFLWSHCWAAKLCLQMFIIKVNRNNIFGKNLNSWIYCLGWRMGWSQPSGAPVTM